MQDGTHHFLFDVPPVGNPQDHTIELNSSPTVPISIDIDVDYIDELGAGTTKNPDGMGNGEGSKSD